MVSVPESHGVGGGGGGGREDHIVCYTGRLYLPGGIVSK